MFSTKFMRIVLTREDVINTPFTNPWSCPMAKVLGKVLNLEKVSFYNDTLRIRPSRNIIGMINPKFSAREYHMLKNGEIKEFITEYTPI